MIYQKSHRKLPPKLLIETVQAKQIENHKYSNLTSNPRAESSDLKININTAPADSLELLPGIGPVYAERIVEHRNENGYFHSLSDLSRIKGIGPGTVEKIASFIVLE